METVIDWSKAPEWAVAYAQVIYEHATTAKDFAWVCAEGYNVNPFGQTEQICHPYKKDFFAADRFRLIEFRPAKGQPWTGEGLPPAETVVELRTVSAKTDWAKAKIKFASRNVVVWDWDGEPSVNGLCTAYAHAIEMRPIRTPEQIAAEEREAAIKEMADIYRNAPGFGVESGIEAIYDANYRKQVSE